MLSKAASRCCDTAEEAEHKLNAHGLHQQGRGGTGIVLMGLDREVPWLSFGLRNASQETVSLEKFGDSFDIRIKSRI